jgi:site-specific recombinase XerD
MKLIKAITTYVTFKRSLGLHFASDDRQLRRFCRAVGGADVNMGGVTLAVVLAYLDGKGPVTATWGLKFHTLDRFYRFAISRGFTADSPLPTDLPQLPPPFVPYIYSTEELRRLIAATEVLATPKSPLRALTFRTLLLLLYGSAIRIGEALSLTLNDVDLEQAILTVRNTKFYKSRIVPTGPNLTEVLSTYATRRRRLPLPNGDAASTFFASSTGNHLRYEAVVTPFQRVRRAAAIRREATASYQPRLHDIRHTSCVHRLVFWYRTGRDVQKLLPRLSTYLGHRDLSSTQIYLTITPELMREASARFERYVHPEMCHD